MKLPFNRRRFALALIGISVNVLLSFFMYRLGLPLFLDTVGTIAASALSGMLLTGIITAVTTNVICSFFNETALYLAFFNALIAIFTVGFVKRHSFKKIGKTLFFTLSLSFASALALSLIQWGLFGQSQQTLVAQNARSFSSAAQLPYFASFFIINFLLCFLDKGFSCVLAVIVTSLFPAKASVPEPEIKAIQRWSRDIKHSLRVKTALTLVIMASLLVLMMSWTGLRLYFSNEKANKTENARNVVKAAASLIDAERVNDYMIYGKEAEGYKATADMLSKIWLSSADVTYLYVLKVEEGGARFIFDVEAPAGSENGIEAYYPGQLVPFEAGFDPYLADLLAGKEIEPVESNDSWGWLLTVFYPVRNSAGRCVCYVGADVSLEYTAVYLRVFFLKVLMMMAGFFILIIAYVLWKTGASISYPISTMAACVDRFARSGEDQEKLDENVRTIRQLDIHTGDEVEKLYQAICRMTLNQAEQMRDIRRLSESTAKMQDGLIITMADMVESRDSDTGAHVQKTAAYVKIIVEGLKKKGYYAQKITPKFMSDVVRSAPLHDVGKINIPDKVLNKPGKLSDEEFAIMKTHTTAGKKILENAISTVQGENYLKEARNMAAYHHERWDGKGYPEGLHGEVIPLSARIMAVADVFDALASPRVYKPAFPLEKALAILKEGAGSQFDAKCVEVFMEALPEVKIILKKYNPTVEW